MSNIKEASASRLDYLSEQVMRLNMKVDELSTRLAAIETDIPMPKKSDLPRPQPIKPQEGVLTRVDEGALLPRIAAICFMLVIALILRTITDNQIINTKFGSLLGMAYAVALIISGWWMYEKNKRLAPVFPGCGLLLLFSIVIETHVRYQSLSATWAYLILLVAGGGCALMSFRYRSVPLGCIGILGTALVAMTIDFPYPIFPLLGVLLLAGNMAAFSAFQKGMCRFLQWGMLTFTSGFWLLWAFKLNTPPVCDAPTSSLLHLSWFFPMLLLFWGMYFYTVILSSLRSDLSQGFFESLLPTISAVGGFWAGRTVVLQWFGNEAWFSVTAMLFAAVHLFLAWWLAKRNRDGAIGSNAFVFAGVSLFALASATLINNIVWVLPIWSLLAYSLALFSEKWGSGGIRVTSYLLQIATCTVALALDAVTIRSSLPLLGISVAALLAGINLFQYRWSRVHKPVMTNSAYFSWLDKNDYSAAVLLVVGLISGFYFVQLGLYEILSHVTSEFDYPFQSGQSVFINLGSILLMFVALRNKNKEMIIVAGAVAAIGAVKVFLFDLFGIKGVPLVVSVFSFGVVAAMASVVMGRWQKRAAVISGG